GTDPVAAAPSSAAGAAPGSAGAAGPAPAASSDTPSGAAPQEGVSPCKAPTSTTSAMGARVIRITLTPDRANIGPGRSEHSPWSISIVSGREDNRVGAGRPPAGDQTA